MKNLRQILLGMALALLGNSATAASITLETTSSGTPYVLYYGDVTAEDPGALDLILTVSGVEYLLMVSGGGDASTGLDLAGVISGHGVTVVVPDGGVCLSACAFAFLGGEQKILEGILGFHVAWSDQDMMTNDAMKIGQYFGLLMSALFVDNGYSMFIPYLTILHTTSDSFIVFTSVEDLDTFYVGDNMPVNDYMDGPSFVDDAWVSDHVWSSEQIAAYIGGTNE